ncbi:MAG: DegT/DnrJ/EryC1/StrS family aminotransferase, partial [Solirubrobacteraceae bacterium]
RIRLPYTAPWAEPVWHLYAVEVARRDAVRAALQEMGIATGVHYPTPIHRQPAYRYLGHGPGALPESEYSAAHVLSLPMFPELTDEQVDRVVDGLLIWRTVYQVSSVDGPLVAGVGVGGTGCSGGKAPSDVLDVGQSHMRGLATPGRWFRRWLTRL